MKSKFLGALLCAAALVSLASAQTTIVAKNGSSQVGAFKKYFVLKCSTGMSCSLVNGEFVMTSSGGSATAAGSDTQVQFNDGGSAFGGATNILYNKTTGQFTVSQKADTRESIYGKRFTDTTPTGNFIHFQNAAANADVFKLDVLGHMTVEGVTSTGATGTGKFVFDTSPVFTTPNLGTPSAINLTNATGFPTLNQNTTGSAAKWTTARNLAGNSVDGSANVAFANKFIVQGTADSGLSAAQFLGALGTGIVKNTTTTGVLSIAIASDFPTLNQNTTGSAATLTTPRAIYGNNFDGSAALAQIIASTYGGTGNGFTKFSGPASSEKTFTLPNASATILTDNAAVTVAQGGTGTGSTLTGVVRGGSPMTAAELSGAVITSGSNATTPGKADAFEASLFCADAGANDTYACNLSPAITGYTTGVLYWFKANTANTGAATLNLNSLGAKTIKKHAGGITTDLSDNDIRAGAWVSVIYDGTNLQCQDGCDGNAPLANPMTTLGDFLYGGASGAPTRLAGASTLDGVPQYLISTSSSSAATAPTLAPAGVPTNAQTGTTYTILLTDRAKYVTFSNASSIAVTLPQAGSTGFASNFVFRACDIGAGTATITPTTSTISYTTGTTYSSGQSNMALTTGQCATIYSDNTNYFAVKEMVNISGNAATATALAADPADCSANNFATAINASGTLTCGQPSISAGVSGLGSGVATFLGTASSANLRSALTDETGTGAAYFQGGDIGTPSAGVGTNITGIPFANVTGRLWSCQPGMGDGVNAITSASYLQSTCKNTTGSTVTITAASCYADAGTPTLNFTKYDGGSHTAILTGAITCSTTFAAGTLSGTPTLANGDWLEFTFAAGGTAKQSTWTVSGTY